jgi:hypothetical protein
MNLGRYIDRCKKNTYVILAIIVILLYLSPFVIMGQGSKVLIQDNLDSNVVWMKTLASSGHILGSFDYALPQIMDGLPRNFFCSAFPDFYVMIWLTCLLGPFNGYVINEFLIHLIAFAGMFLLLKRHFPKIEEHGFLLAGSSLAFALLPFWPPGGLSVAGMPLVLYAFMNIRSGRQTVKDWLILAIVPIYSIFVASYLFFLTGIGMIMVYDFAKTKHVDKKMALAVGFMASVSIALNYRLVYTTFFSRVLSQRSEFSVDDLSSLDALKSSFVMFFGGQYHVASLQEPVIGITVLLALICIAFYFLRNSKWTLYISGFLLAISLLDICLALNILPGNPYLTLLDLVFSLALWSLILLLIAVIAYKRFIARSTDSVLSGNMTLFVLIVIVGLVSLSYGFSDWGAIGSIKGSIDLLNMLQMRFYWLNPLLWYLIFPLSLAFIFKEVKHGKQLVPVLLLVQIIFLFAYHGPVTQSGGLGELADDQMSYGDFFSVPLFQEIRDYIGKPQSDYRIASLGMYPSIAQYNGFFTLDSYQEDYPLAYKRQFRTVIAGELDRNESLKDYYDGWGSRAYLFSAELWGQGYIFTKYDDRKINVSLNTSALKDMGGRFVFSAVEILNSGDNNLTLCRTFERNDSPWIIWLYEIDWP